MDPGRRIYPEGAPHPCGTIERPGPRRSRRPGPWRRFRDNRWSVGGRIAEGPRWWRGELSWDSEPIELRAGTQITVELEDGRSAAAVVEAVPTSDAVAVRGIEPPPFTVP